MRTNLRAGLLLILLMMLAGTLMGCSCEREPEAPAVVEPAEPEDETVTVTLYFSDDQAMYVMPEEREVVVKDDSDEALATAILNELIAGPQTEGLYRTIPAESQVLGLEIKDGLVAINWNSEFQTGHSGGSAGEFMTRASIANSLTELDSVQQVKILIDGEPIDSLAGHFDFSEPLQREEDAIGK
ncbi:MAG: GerMN domain-containing protein [Syntrophomonadaceae bacterium]|nr:GerMN domain-containing protein [Syntrophomonadaceae bacterium]